MQDPWGIEFAPAFLGRDTCRTPMAWSQNESNAGFSKANDTWLPIDSRHVQRAGLDEAARSESVYNHYSSFLKWRKEQPAFMSANTMSEVSGGDKHIVFDRVSSTQSLRCVFDFETLTTSFEEI